MSDERECYRRYVSSDGFEILVGRTATDNDELTFQVAKPNDFWLHVAPTSGSHVVVRNPDNLERLPRTTLREAAALAAYHSKSREGGRVAVHYTRCRQVRKPRGVPPGQVQLQDYQTLQVSPRERPPEPESENQE